MQPPLSWFGQIPWMRSILLGRSSVQERCARGNSGGAQRKRAAYPPDDTRAGITYYFRMDELNLAAETCDVAVIGGGPGGSTAATLLARRGYRVIALEKARHPRFHIGESLLPMNLPVFERLGVLDKVRALGVFKPGADFEPDNARGYNTFAFARAIGNSPPHAYQVWRQDFDKMLYEHARACGASAREGHEAVNIEQNGPRDTRLDVRTDDGRSYRIEARYVVDASGRDTFLSAKKKLRRKNNQHQSAAIFGHFRGADARSGEDAGNISMYRFEHGWMWMIPLPEGGMR